MVISVGANYEAELNQESGARPVILLSLNFTTGFRRFAFWPHDVVYSGNTFTGLGPVQNADPAQLTQDTPLTEQFLAFFVQNNPDFLADIQQNSRGRFCTGRLVFLDDAGAVIDGEAITLWHKRMVPGRLTGDERSYMSEMGLESRFHRHRNRAPRTYSQAEQHKSRDATDFAFKDVGKSLDFSRDKYRQKSGLGF
jgi:hypothetical protein